MKLTKRNIKRIVENVILLEEIEEEIVDVLDDNLDVNDGLVQTVNFLNSKEGQDEKVRDALLKDPNVDEVISVTDTSFKCGKYLPTQKEISMAASIGWPLSNWASCKNIPSGDPTGGQGNGKDENGDPIPNRVVVSGNLVVDGHHRWSQVFAIGGGENPLLVTDLGIPVEGTGPKLAVTQVAIVATMEDDGPVPSEDKGVPDNVLGEKQADIKTKIESQIGQAMDSGKPLLSDEWCEEAKNDPLGGTLFGLNKDMDNDTVRETVVDKVSLNLSKLPAPAQGAPERKLMPQFSLKTKPEEVMANMEQGKVNWKEPFNESIDINRWSKLAGLLKD